MQDTEPEISGRVMYAELVARDNTANIAERAATVQSATFVVTNWTHRLCVCQNAAAVKGSPCMRGH